MPKLVYIAQYNGSQTSQRSRTAFIFDKYYKQFLSTVWEIGTLLLLLLEEWVEIRD